MNYEKQLKDLRNKLAREQMSLLVGAGFSKNVHHSFLSWDELLFDLTNEIYADEIKNAYQKIAKASSKPKLTLKAFSKQKCKEITARIGYLEVVSEYIRRKGFPESIATYIEDRTPSIEKDGTNFLLKIGSRSIPVKAGNLNLHRKVVELPWNNIYTTNYDHLLDICIDDNQVTKLRREIDGLENETLDLYRAREQLNKEKEELPEFDDTSKFSGLETPIDVSHSSSDLKKDDDEKNRKEIQGKIDLNDARIKEVDQGLKEKETALLNRYHVVRDAADLRLKRTKNIIKLHGSLRNQEEKERFYFQFDNDPHKQYVIAKEDYDSYPQKHEAFTQLMRIALLQESFCLIGFSGVDPNFKAWINWVKDILYKEAIKNKKQQYKIFLIDAGSSEIKADQQLFYENHSIIRIPLQSPEVIQFLEAECSKRVIIKDRASALKAFLIFLGNGDLINPEVSQSELSAEKEKMKVWRDFSVFDIQNKPKHETLVDTLQQLQDIQTKTWIGNLNYTNTHNQHSLINYVNYKAWKAYIMEDDKDHALKKLLLLALKEYYVPIYNFIDEDVVNILLDTGQTQSDTLLLLERANSLNVRKSENQGFYEDLLQLAYSFQFKKLRSKLNKWAPKGREHIQKAGFLSLFDSKESARQLELVIEDDYILSDEELLYGYELLHFLQNSYTWPVDKKLGRAIRSYETAGLQTLKDKFEYILEQFKAKLTKPAPLGENRYSTSRSINFRNHTEPEAALQFLMLLAESGYQLMIRRTYQYTSESWYNLMLSGFEHYPYAFLFYSLQYSDEKFLKRLGQHYAYSEGNQGKVRNELPEITRALLANFQDAPVDYQHHALVFLSKLIIAVDPDVWQDDFLIIWNLLLKQGVAFENPARYSYLNFFVSGLQYINDPTIILKVVADALKHIKKSEPDHAISYLYYLNRNVYYNTAKDIGISQALTKLIDNTIRNLSQNDDNIIFVLGNIHALMSDAQKGKIRELIRSFDFTKIRNSRAWRIFLYFIDGEKQTMTTFKAAVLESNGIWHTGVKDNVYSMGGMHLIELSKLIKSEYLSIGFELTPDEIEKLYHKLTEQLPGIQYFTSLDRETKFDFVDVLDEMQKFLIAYKPQLVHLNGFEDTIASVSKMFYVDRNYKELEDGLISNDHSTVVWSLSELSPVVYKDLANPMQVKTVFYKVLLQHEPALEAAISYLSAWSKDLLSRPEFSDVATLYLEILQRYKTNPLDDADVAFVDLNLIVIAEQLHSIGHKNETIDWWLKKSKESVYNNIKQHLLKSGYTGS